jgi:cytochrome b pre-mRNA-processing protein 3
MNSKYLNIYNNLIKLTRNKEIFEKLSNDETFSDRLILLMIHFAFFIKVYKKPNNKK